MATLTEVAKALNVTGRRVNQLVNEGMPRKARGEYPLDACLRWYVRYLQGLLEAKVDPAGRADALQFTRDKSRLARAQSELAEMKAAAQRGDLVPLSLIANEFGKSIANMRTLVLGMPSRLAPEVHALSTEAECSAAIEKVCLEVLEGIVNWRPRPPKGARNGHKAGG